MIRLAKKVEEAEAWSEQLRSRSLDRDLPSGTWVRVVDDSHPRADVVGVTIESEPDVVYWVPRSALPVVLHGARDWCKTHQERRWYEQARRQLAELEDALISMSAIADGLRESLARGPRSVETVRT